VLSSLPAELRIGGRRRLVVNLSLGATIPVPPRRHWARWLPATHSARAQTDTRPQPDAATRRLLDDAHSSLFSMMNWLHRQGVLVVAAAGNDASRPQTHEGIPPPPRYPARYQQVFAVAAVGPDGSPASYSNRADVLPLGNGITSFGGEIGRDGAGVVGVYSANTFPGGAANTTGWAQWAGTSFATPIIAGLASRLWSQDDHQQPSDLMQRIRGFARPMTSDTVPDQDPDGALDAPLLPAWQEYVPPA
jgi:subtilisin family serine protease